MRLVYTILLFTAFWTGQGQAEITFSNVAHTCLAVQHATGERAVIGCFQKAGVITVTLGGPLTDGVFRPQNHDVYVLVDSSGAVLSRAPLVGRPVYLGVVLR